MSYSIDIGYCKRKSCTFLNWLWWYVSSFDLHRLRETLTTKQVTTYEDSTTTHVVGVEEVKFLRIAGVQIRLLRWSRGGL